MTSTAPPFWKVLLLVILLPVWIDTAPGEDGKPVFRAGAASADVTPPPGLPMWGYGARKDLPARGVRDPLLATAAVLTVGEQRLALVGLDLGRSPARTSMERIRRNVRDAVGVQHLFIVGSHTHHGPCLELEKTPPTAAYIDELIEKITAVILEAARKARPARLGVGRKEVELNRNRHTKYRPKPVDRQLLVLRIDDLEGKPIATVVNFAAHPTTRPAAMLQYSADFPGPMREHVSGKVGGICVFLQGAAGDLSTDRQGKSTDEYGVALGEEVVRLCQSTEPEVPDNPSIRVRTEEFRFSRRIDLEDPLTYLKYCVAFFPALIDAYVEEYRDGIRPNISVALINEEIGIVGASGEVFCSHAIRLRERSRLPHLLFLGYCNGYHQYFPTLEAVAEGGYGADPPVSPVEVGAGERMFDRALFHLYDLRKKIVTGP